MMGCRTSGGESRLLALLVAEAAGGDDVASGGQLKRIRSVSNMHTHTQTHTLELALAFDLGHLTAELRGLCPCFCSCSFF